VSGLAPVLPTYLPVFAPRIRGDRDESGLTPPVGERTLPDPPQMLLLFLAVEHNLLCSEGLHLSWAKLSPVMTGYLFGVHVYIHRRAVEKLWEAPSRLY
jgi:hypothetical protein